MKSTWTTNYKNNEIRVENTWFKGERLFVNDTLQDEKFGIFSSDLTGHIINTKNEKESISNVDDSCGFIFNVYCM